MQITLSPQQERFIKEQLAQGTFQSANDVIDRALRLLESQQQDRDAWVEEVQGKVDEAIAELGRGEGIPLETVVDQLQAKIRAARELQE
ncbi:type II toxin-antitoxin system ParD family antitoxin [filamentous cyanobacterium CCT1]|nr:type II toxin-antitoxin system ParD family antitoxin [filamentous cyanobacterium CCT1]PSN80333.1 type II toxin-antitoxin system ParD family antitoxin [filamentous cyanobacterium CCP4]